MNASRSFSLSHFLNLKTTLHTIVLAFFSVTLTQVVTPCH